MASTPADLPRRKLSGIKPVVIFFAVFNLAIWAWFIAGRSNRGLLRVDSFEPGNNSIVQGRPTFTWKFNLDVDHDRTGSNSPIKITPALAGDWHWTDGRTLLFTPSDNLPAATPIRFEMQPQSLRTADDFRLAQAVINLVNTQPLEVRDVRQAGMLDNNQFLLEFAFSDRVLPADVQSHLKLLGPDGKQLGYQPHGSGVDKIVRVLTDPLPRLAQAPVVTIQLTKDLGGLSGPLGLTQPYEKQLTLEDGIVCTEMSAVSPSYGDIALRATFNSDVDTELVKQVISVEPPVPFTLSSSGRDVDLEGAFVSGRRYAVKFGDPRPGSETRKFPRAGTFSVFVPDRAPSVSFEHSDGVLGSKGNRTLLAHAVNVPQVKVEIFRVYENNLVAWRNSTGRFRWTDLQAYSRPIATRRIKLANLKNKSEDIRLQIDDLLPPGSAIDGVYRVALYPDQTTASDTDDPQAETDDEPAPRRFRHGRSDSDESTVVTLSDIGLVAKQHRAGVTVWAVSLSTAKPMPNVRVRIYSDKNQLLGESVTDNDGLATVDELHPASEETPRVILADRQTPTTNPATTEAATTHPTDTNARSELTWLDMGERSWDLAESEVSGRPYLRQGMEAFVYTDRGIYRPGETVQLRAIVRYSDGAVDKSFPLRWQFIRPDRRPWRGEITMLDADGSAGLSLALPNDLVTGRWTAQVGIPDEAGGTAKPLGQVAFSVEEFMPVRMKVGMRIGSGRQADPQQPRVHVDAKPIMAHVQADYLFGQPATNLHGELTATLEPTLFSSPQWQGWSFGDAGDVCDRRTHVPVNPDWTHNPREIELDEQGHATVELKTSDLMSRPVPCTRPSDLGVDRFVGPWRLATEASIEEAGGRAVAGSTSAMVDMQPWYIGICPPTEPIRPHEASEFSVALVSPEGTGANASPTLSATLYFEKWNTTLVTRNGHYEFESTRFLEPAKDTVISTVHPVDSRATVAVHPPRSGTYVLRVRDQASGSMSSVSFVASDGNAWADNVSRENPEHVGLVLLNASATTEPSTQHSEKEVDRSVPVFKAGEKARVLVRSPFAGRLLLTVETDSVLQTQVIDMPASQTEVAVEVTPAFWPNAYITATVVRDVQPNLQWRTHRAYGVRRLSLDNSDRKLNVDLISPAGIRPNSPLNVSMRITDPNGTPTANAAVTVAAVDEGILELTAFKTPDPLHFFAADRALGVTSWDLYSDLMPEVPRADSHSAVGGDGDSGSDDRHRSGVAAKRVKPVALFSGVLHADGSGRLQTTFAVPQHAGQLRLMAVAYNSTCVGSGEGHVLVRSPVVAQSSSPRFVAPGDRFCVTVRVFNNTNTPGDATVTAELGSDSLLQFGDNIADTRRAYAVGNVPAGGQRDVTIPLLARQRVGPTTLKLISSIGAEHAEESIELPVRPASPQITRGGYAIAEPDKPAQLKIDDDMLPGTGQVEVHVNNWPSLQLPQGLDYLEQYPYGCAEQTTSSCFPLVVLGDIGAHLSPGMFEKQRVDEKLRVGVLRLMGMQTADGGLSMWPGESRSWPWVSVYAANMLVEAQRAGHAVPDDFLRRLMTYVRHQLQTNDDNGDVIELQSYVCYVLALVGKPDRAAMSRLTELATARTAATPIEFAAQRGQARLYLAMAQVACNRPDQAAALIPPAENIPQPRLLRQSTGNIGSETRDRAMMINAMLAATPAHPALPDLVQKLADTGRAGGWRSTQECAFAVMALGHYLKQAQSHAPFTDAHLQAGERILATASNGNLFWKGDAFATPLRVDITGGAGCRGNVSWTQVGVPMKPPSDGDHGMRIRRRYTGRDGESRGAFSTGELIRVDLDIEAPPGQGNLVIEDMLPAGLEIENPRLETSARQEKTESAEEPARFVPDRLEMRDDRLVIAGSMPQNWRARFTYLARAVTVGTYVLPPVRGECMYDIGINSINGAGTFTVNAWQNASTAKTE